MTQKPFRIAVTGGAGQIAYSLLFRLASGELFGAKQPIALHILEVPEALQTLEGVRMELMDCAFPLLKEVVYGSDPYEIFDGVDLALLVGAKPRGPGMERGELLAENAKIFVQQGQALDKVASANVRVVVVGNPCNTNCYIALQQCKRLRPRQFSAMTRLDQNRAQALLADKAHVDVDAVSRVIFWGNHSATQVPDAYNAYIGKQHAPEVIADKRWVEEQFVSQVQKRGAAVIAARGKSSAASAANAIIDHVKALYIPTPDNGLFSMAVYSQGNGYGVDQDLIFSFPCRSRGNGDYDIVEGLPWNDFLRAKITITQDELRQERQDVLSLDRAP